VGGANESIDEEMDFEEATVLKVRLMHMVFSERTENEIIDLTKRLLTQRRLWVKDELPTAAEFLKQYPRFTDTPPLVSFKTNDSSTTSVLLEMKFSCGSSVLSF
jgi:hypothetical protein